MSGCIGGACSISGDSADPGESSHNGERGKPGLGRRAWVKKIVAVAIPIFFLLSAASPAFASSSPPSADTSESTSKKIREDLRPIVVSNKRLKIVNKGPVKATVDAVLERKGDTGKYIFYRLKNEKLLYPNESIVINIHQDLKGTLTLTPGEGERYAVLTERGVLHRVEATLIVGTATPGSTVTATVASEVWKGSDSASCSENNPGHFSILVPLRKLGSGPHDFKVVSFDSDGDGEIDPNEGSKGFKPQVYPENARVEGNEEDDGNDEDAEYKSETLSLPSGEYDLSDYSLVDKREVEELDLAPNEGGVQQVVEVGPKESVGVKLKSGSKNSNMEIRVDVGIESEVSFDLDTGGGSSSSKLVLYSHDGEWLEDQAQLVWGEDTVEWNVNPPEEKGSYSVWLFDYSVSGDEDLVVSLPDQVPSGEPHGVIQVKGDEEDGNVTNEEVDTEGWAELEEGEINRVDLGSVFDPFEITGVQPSGTDPEKREVSEESVRIEDQKYVFKETTKWEFEGWDGTAELSVGVKAQNGFSGKVDFNIKGEDTSLDIRKSIEVDAGERDDVSLSIDPSKLVDRSEVEDSDSYEETFTLNLTTTVGCPNLCEDNHVPAEGENWRVERRRDVTLSWDGGVKDEATWKEWFKIKASENMTVEEGENAEIPVTIAGKGTNGESFSGPVEVEVASTDGSIADAYITDGDLQINSSEVTNLKVEAEDVSDDSSGEVTVSVEDSDPPEGVDALKRTTTIDVSVKSNKPATVDFRYTPQHPTTQDTVQFTEQASDPDGRIVSYEWEFGDGATSSKANPTHSYDDDGTYTVTLTVTDDDGITSSHSEEITVSNVPPNADFAHSPDHPKTSETIRFNERADDPDGHIVSYRWNWTAGQDSTYDATGRSPSHSYADEGTYTVELKVTDDDGDTDTYSREITVSNTGPSVDFDYSPNRPEAKETVHFYEQASDPDDSIKDYTWEFGDGHTSDSPNPEHTYSDDGSYTVTLIVTDHYGNSARHSEEITVVNAGPTADFTYSPDHPAVDDTVQFTEQASDPDGRIVSYEWEFGDGGTSDRANPSHSYSDEGIYTVELTVRDDDGATDSYSKDVYVHGDEPPVAVDDTVSTGEGEPVTIDVLKNDYDPEGEGVKIVGIVDGPEHGKAELGSVEYTPNEGFTGTDTIKYKITDESNPASYDYKLQWGEQKRRSRTVSDLAGLDGKLEYYYEYYNYKTEKWGGSGHGSWYPNYHGEIWQESGDWTLVVKDVRGQTEDLRVTSYDRDVADRKYKIQWTESGWTAHIWWKELQDKDYKYQWSESHTEWFDDKSGHSGDVVKTKVTDRDYKIQWTEGGWTAHIWWKKLQDKDYKYQWSEPQTEWVDDKGHRGTIVDRKVSDRDYRVEWTTSTPHWKWYDTRSGANNRGDVVETRRDRVDTDYKVEWTTSTTHEQWFDHSWSHSGDQVGKKCVDQEVYYTTQTHSKWSDDDRYCTGSEYWGNCYWGDWKTNVVDKKCVDQETYYTTEQKCHKEYVGWERNCHTEVYYTTDRVRHTRQDCGWDYSCHEVCSTEHYQCNCHEVCTGFEWGGNCYWGHWETQCDTCTRQNCHQECGWDYSCDTEVYYTTERVRHTRQDCDWEYVGYEQRCHQERVKHTRCTDHDYKIQWDERIRHTRCTDHDYKIRWTTTQTHNDRIESYWDALSHQGSIVDRYYQYDTDYRAKWTTTQTHSREYDDYWDAWSKERQTGGSMSSYVADRDYKYQWSSEKSKWVDDKGHQGSIAKTRKEWSSKKHATYDYDEEYDAWTAKWNQVHGSGYKYLDYEYEWNQETHSGWFDTKDARSSTVKEEKPTSWTYSLSWVVDKTQTGWFDEKSAHPGATVLKKKGVYDSDDTDTATVTIHVGTQDQPPVAEADGPYSVDEGDTTQLDGSGSRNPGDGSIVNYDWKIVSDPTGEARIQEPKISSSPYAKFMAPDRVSRDYTVTVQLEVTGSGGETATDTSTVDINNVSPSNEPPTADAGGPYTVNEDSTEELDGEGSNDPDGSIDSYSWSITDDPTGQAYLTGEGTSTPVFHAPGVSSDKDVTVKLTVTDDDRASDSDSTTVTVKNTVKKDPSVETVSATNISKSKATLNSDIHYGDYGQVEARFLYREEDSGSSWSGWYGWGSGSDSWDKTSWVTINSGNHSERINNLQSNTTYEFKAKIRWLEGGSYKYDTGSIKTFTTGNVLRDPIAEIDPVSSVDEGSSITLDGSDSHDRDEGQSSITDYAWEKVNGPGSISGKDSAKPTYSAPEDAGAQDETVKVKLTVTDDEGATDSETETFTINDPDSANEAPSVDIDPIDSVDEGNSKSVHADASDPDGDDLDYSWFVKSGPGSISGSGEDVTYSAPADSDTSDETVKVKVSVDDDHGHSDSDTETFTIDDTDTPPSNDPPNAEPHDETVDEGSSVELSEGSTDPDGSIESYSWTITDDPTGGASLSDSDTSKPTFDAPSVSSDTDVTVELTVEDDDGATDTDIATVTVNNVPPSNGPPTAKFTYTPEEPKPGETIDFDASESSDPDGSIDTYEWDWTNNGVYEGSGETPSHSYPSEGDYTVKLRVTDDDEATDTATKTITVKKVATEGPTADADGPYNADEGGHVDLSAEDSTGDIDTYSWKVTSVDMRDGCCNCQLGNDAGDLKNKNSVTPIYDVTREFVTNCNGVYREPDKTVTVKVKLTVSGPNGSDSDTTKITITDGGGDEVIADANGPYDVKAGNTIKLDGSGSSQADIGTDPQGIDSYSWKIVEGSGSLIDKDSVKPTYSAPSSVSSETTVEVELTVKDDGFSDDATTRITVKPGSGESQSVTIEWTDSPIDEEGSDYIRASSEGFSGGLTYEWTLDGKGSLSSKSGQYITYEAPDELDSQIEPKISVVVEDDDGDTGTASYTPTVKPVDDEPVIDRLSIPESTKEPNHNYKEEVLAVYASDPDDKLTYSWEITDGPGSLESDDKWMVNYNVPYEPNNCKDDDVTFKATVSEKNGDGESVSEKATMTIKDSDMCPGANILILPGIKTLEWGATSSSLTKQSKFIAEKGTMTVKAEEQAFDVSLKDTYHTGEVNYKLHYSDSSFHLDAGESKQITVYVDKIQLSTWDDDWYSVSQDKIVDEVQGGSHLYSHTVTVKAKSDSYDEKGTDSATLNAYVGLEKSSPKAVIKTDSSTVDEDYVLGMEGEDSSDPQGQNLDYKWEVISGPGEMNPDEDREKNCYYWAADGGEISEDTEVTIELTVTDPDGNSDSATKTITVLNDKAPTAEIVYDDYYAVEEGGDHIISATDSSDPETPESELDYYWDVEGYEGEIKDINGDEPDDRVRYEAPDDISSDKEINVTVTVYDGVVQSDSDTTTVHVSDVSDTNEAPSVTIKYTDSPIDEEGSDYLYAEASDPDGDSLSYSWSVSGVGSVDGDGGSWEYYYAPDEISSNKYPTITVTVDDGNGGSDTDYYYPTVEPVNDAPTADITFPSSVDEGGDVVIPDSQNSSDPDGDSLTYSWEVTSGPGSIYNVGGNKSYVTYEVSSDSDCSDESADIKMTVSDGSKSDSVTKSITVNDPDSCDTNEAPTASFSMSTPVDEGGSAYPDALDSSDPDGDSLSYSWSVTSGPGSISNASGGKGVVTYEANADDSDCSDESATIELTVEDEHGATDSVSKTFTINDPDSCNTNSDPSVTIKYTDSPIDEEGSDWIFADASDPDGDDLTYSWSHNGVGSLSDTSGDDTTYYAPDEISSNKYPTITVTVEDGNGGSDTDYYYPTVDPVNDAPEITKKDIPGEADEEADVWIEVDGEDPEGTDVSYSWSLSGYDYLGSIEWSDDSLAYWHVYDYVTDDHYVTVKCVVEDGTGKETTVSKSVWVEDIDD